MTRFFLQKYFISALIISILSLDVPYETEILYHLLGIFKKCHFAQVARYCIL